jgi:hypothetical protein
MASGPPRGGYKKAQSFFGCLILGDRLQPKVQKAEERDV